MKLPVVKIRKINNAETGIDGVSDVLSKIYLTRGITSSRQLNYQLDQLPSPQLLKDNNNGAKLLAKAITRQQRLLILADFDVDGATSCALMKLALESLGATHVDYLVPDRFKFGYGLTAKIVDVAATYSPDLIVTVDNGIASIEGVDRANELGINVLITDHHLPGKALPDAKCIVNPNQPDCNFPSKALAGVGVAFYLILALRKQLRDQGWFTQSQISEPNLSQYLDLVALGTIADLAPLDHCNRILVAQGLKRIQAGYCRPGIIALLNLAKRDFSRIQASDLGFYVGPRLNAAGRLDDMSLGIECLLTQNHTQALEMAAALDNLNKERRQIEQNMQEQALVSLEKLFKNQEFDDEKTATSTKFGFCLYQPDWHQGIIGLLASRVKDKVNRPVIIFADASVESKQLKGSARSIPGLHIKDVLDQLATEKPHLLQQFGGHAMAAGMTIDKQNMDEFSYVFDAIVTEKMGGRLADNILWSDAELPVSHINIQLARELRDAGPWGQAFAEPKFHGNFNVISKRILSGKHLKLQLENSQGAALEGISFFVDEALLNAEMHKVNLYYKIDINFFREQENLQLLIEHIVLL
ncbi:MAG: single-stranded-DNA-specific exonuclease RecJ [Gammaproteobacteria bacterium]|nr:single-stranded-DNA-specific exonuclease RecJ [Gammaproteobacteria bacterium]